MSLALFLSKAEKSSESFISNGDWSGDFFSGKIDHINFDTMQFVWGGICIFVVVASLHAICPRTAALHKASRPPDTTGMTGGRQRATAPALGGAETMEHNPRRGLSVSVFIVQIQQIFVYKLIKLSKSKQVAVRVKLATDYCI